MVPAAGIPDFHYRYRYRFVNLGAKFGRHLVGVWIGGIWNGGNGHFPESGKYFSEAEF